MITKGTLYRGRARAIGEAVEAWKAAHEEAMAVRDLEEIVAGCIEQRDDLRALLAEGWESLFAGKLPRPLQVGAVVRSALRDTVEAFAALQEVIQGVRAARYEVDRADEFFQAVEEMRRLQADVEKRWPRFALAELQAGIAQMERGEGQAVEDILRELQGNHPAGG